MLGSLELPDRQPLDRQPLEQEARRQLDRAQLGAEQGVELARQMFAEAQSDHARKNAEVGEIGPVRDRGSRWRASIRPSLRNHGHAAMLAHLSALVETQSNRPVGTPWVDDPGASRTRATRAQGSCPSRAVVFGRRVDRYQKLQAGVWNAMSRSRCSLALIGSPPDNQLQIADSEHELALKLNQLRNCQQHPHLVLGRDGPFAGLASKCG